jgi:hypothetical protein
MLVAVSFLYNAYGIPLRCAYPYQTPDNVWAWMLLDYIADAVDSRSCAITHGLT